MDSVVATVSGYHGSERFRLIKLISQTGASYVGAMNRSTTHLVCWKFEGKKYELAKKFKIIVVNHRWIEDCVKQGRRVPEHPYTKRCGLEVGPLLETPVVTGKLSSTFCEGSSACNLSKEPVIDIECDETGDDAWTDSWLLKENLLPDMRRNKDCSNSSKRKGIKRTSRQYNTPQNGYNFDERPPLVKRRMEPDNLNCPSSSHLVNNQKKRSTTTSESSRRSSRLVHRNTHNEGFKYSSDLNEDCRSIEIHPHDIDITAPSRYSPRNENRRPHNDWFHDHVERRSVVLEDVEKTEDLKTCFDLEGPTRTDGGTSSLSRNSEDNSADVDGDSYGMDYGPKLSKPQHLSCVICWTDFSSSRGVLPCGHRFCFSCIQNWADHMASMNKVSTCPLCKASFYSIKKMDEAVSCDQKIYSQTIPNDPSAMDVYILPQGQAPTLWTMPSAAPVCYQCCCREPEELLVRCHRCQVRCVHSYCLDPPQIPWICIQCKDLRMRYPHLR